MDLPFRHRSLWLMPLALRCAAAALVPISCANHHDEASADAAIKVALSGTVTDEGGAPLSGATVTAAGQSTATDATGTYHLSLVSTFGNNTGIAATADGHAPASAVTTVTGPVLARDIMLRKVGQAQSVALPTAANANVAVALNGNDGNSVLTLVVPAHSLVFADGTEPSGNVDITLTHWAADDTFASAPAPLWGVASADTAQTLMPLVSYGMADIAIKQAGRSLQVASGQSLELVFAVDDTQADLIVNASADAQAAPQLWSADANAGVWVHEGTLASGALTYDSVSKALHARLPHLSAWNVDSVTTGNGCVTGKLVDCSGKLLTNTAASLWMMGKGSVGKYPLQSGADGSFCATIGGISGDDKTSTGFYFVSLPNAPAESVCNPTGRDTFAQLCGSSNPSSFACITGGENNDESSAFYYSGLQRCGIGSKSFQMCGYCSGQARPAGICATRTRSLNYGFAAGACTDLGSITLNNGSCSGATPTSASTTTTTTTPVDPCKGKGDMTGKACSSDPDCCAATLECKDATCVPKAT